jgi:hypothetical protein
MQTSKPEDTQIDTVVRSLIRRIARGGRAPADPMPARVRPGRSRQLEAAAIRLLETLPPTLRMVALRGQFPRILNRLADAWHSPSAFDALTGSLLIDDRGQRQGFPFEVVAELAELREYYFAMVHPEARPQAGGAAFRGFR